MGPKSRILEIWNRAIFGFQGKILSYGLEIGQFSRIWFSRIGRGRQILENGHPFSREIGLSGKWSLCYMVRLLVMPRVFVTFDTCCVGAKNRWPDHTPTRSTKSSASSPSDSESNSKLSAMEVIDGNDDVLAAGIAVAATMQLFVCTPETSHVGTNRTRIVLKTSPQENAYLTIYQGASGREKRSNE